MHPGFSIEAQAYARGRPDYPAGVLPWFLRRIECRRVVDMGAGTGKFTALLAQNCTEVIAVEPGDAMRFLLEAYLPSLCAIDGNAEAIPLDTASADALFCAQAFHWFATNAALEEIHRVLTPGGMLGLVWNVRDESVDWVAAITEIITPYEINVPRFYTGDWRKIFPSTHFSALESASFAHTHIGPAQEVIIDRIMSVSFIASLPEIEKCKVNFQLQSLIASHSALRDQEIIEFPYITEAYRCFSKG